MTAPGHGNNFDALRLIAATTVIFSHSFLIADGNENHEPLILLTGRQSILGLAGVFVFFAISGFLVTQSYEQTQSPLRYLAKRVLRVFPGLVAALVLSAFVLAPLVTMLPLGEYLRRAAPYRYVLWNTLLDLRVHELPKVLFVDNPVGLEVNGSLWTLRYEFEMYLMVMALGLAGLIRVPVLLLLLGLGLACIHFPAFDRLGGWGWLLAFFVMGMLLYKLRAHPHLRRSDRGGGARRARAFAFRSGSSSCFSRFSAAISRSGSRSTRACRSFRPRASAISPMASTSTAGRRSRR